MEAGRLGNPSFIPLEYKASVIIGYSQQMLPVGWNGLVLQRLLHCLHLDQSFLPVFVCFTVPPNVKLKPTHTFFLSHSMQTRLLQAICIE